MSEEIKSSSRNVPRAMICSILLNGSLGIGMLLAILFCLGDIDVILGSSTGYPFMEIFRQAIGENGGALTMATLLVILNFCATISFVATASRMTWSFARDRGVPGWRYLSKVGCQLHVPLFQYPYP